MAWDLDVLPCALSAGPPATIPDDNTISSPQLTRSDQSDHMARWKGSSGLNTWTMAARVALRGSNVKGPVAVSMVNGSTA
mgnify:CR=1 FL=1